MGFLQIINSRLHHSSEISSALAYTSIQSVKGGVTYAEYGMESGIC